MGGGGGRRRTKTRYERSVPHEGYTSSAGKGGTPMFDDCETIKFTTDIVRPTPATVSLIVGEVLLISLDASGNARLFTSPGVHCGYIIGKQVDKMVDCIHKGHDYQATVTIAGVSHTVRIEHK